MLYAFWAFTFKEFWNLLYFKTASITFPSLLTLLKAKIISDAYGSLERSVVQEVFQPVCF